MLEKYLKRNDVLQFMEEIQMNERYFQKNIVTLADSFFEPSHELALYIFYDALYKYELIINDIYLFDEYLEQLEKLYRKLNDFDNIRIGIHKLIGRMLLVKLGIRDLTKKESREELITYVYNQYILNGYFIHGFSNVYEDSILDKDFIPDEYENNYDRFQKISTIFFKYHVPLKFSKDFSDSKLYFTDDVVLGCYYSIYAPMFFSNFIMNSLFGKRFRKDQYAFGDYDDFVNPLKKFMSNNLFREEDRNYILNVVKDEWDFLHQKEKRISMLLIPRKRIMKKEVSLEDLLKDDNDVFDVIDRILSSKYNTLSCDNTILKDDVQILSFDIYNKEIVEKTLVEEKEEELYYQYREKEIETDFLNVYGNVSFLILLGSLWISFGVLLTIFTILGG